jgi:NADPH:quinone reductase-like Zn-dependent oxidoreductase
VVEGPNKGLADLAELLESGHVVPVVDSVYPLSDAPKALSYFAEGRHKGKIVIEIGNRKAGAWGHPSPES